MTVYLFNFSKRENSTSQPVLNTGTSFTVQLKDNCSTLEPVLIFNPGSTGMPNPFNPSAFNYAYIASFSRYYFVKDWTYLNGVWEVSLTVDVLASFKTAIGTSSEYVVRSASNSDGNIVDGLYPAKSNVSNSTVNITNPFSSTSGFYIVGIINKDSNPTQGAVTYYLMTAAQMGTFKHYLMDDAFLTANGLDNLQNMNKELLKCVYNPFQYIASCKYFPISSGSIAGTSVSSVEFGWWSVPVSATRMVSSGYVYTFGATATIPSHPDAATRGAYLNHAPYTEHMLYFAPFGSIPIDANKANGGDQLTITITVDGITGEAIFTLYTTSGGVLYQTTCQFAIDIQLAQISTDVLQTARTAVNAAGNVAQSLMNFNIGGAIAGAATGVIDTIAASVPQLQSSGTNGSLVQYVELKKLVSHFYRPANEDNTHRGRPLCQVKTINTLSGYIMVADADVAISAFESEKQKIKTYMETGFYYE